MHIFLKEGEKMMPLTLAEVGEENIIKKIGGRQEVRSHLENLGFIAGGAVTVINTIGGNVIVNVKESRIAISKEMAQKIMI
jgi:ferrous iron transport protein A